METGGPSPMSADIFDGFVLPKVKIGSSFFVSLSISGTRITNQRISFAVNCWRFSILFKTGPSTR